MLFLKIGFDFGEIEWEKRGNTMDESIFRQITLEENNEALEALKQDAQDNAVANGLLDK